MRISFSTAVTPSTLRAIWAALLDSSQVFAVPLSVTRDVLAGFSDLVLERSDYESAAQYYNICRGHGIQGSNTDFLICAVAVARDMPILSVDQDFTLFQKYLQLKLYPLPIGL